MAFIFRLFDLAHAPTSPDDTYLRWADDGKAFWIVNPAEFTRRVIPKFFKHTKFSSFIRQLNVYGKELWLIY
jgi:hypothetical protein